MKDNDSGGNFDFLGVLTIAFIVLKLTKTISWSWTWVLAPIWIPILICVIIAFIMEIKK